MGIQGRLQGQPASQIQKEKTKKNIYMLIIITILLLVISIIFYMIAAIDGAMFGTPDDEVDSIISEKMKEIIQSVDEQSGEVTATSGQNFEKFAFAMKIVPNMD